MKIYDISKFRPMVVNIVDVGWATIKSGCLPITGEKVEDLESHFGALEGPNLKKISGRIRIRSASN